MNIDKTVINNLRVFACQAIEKANSGHPGIVLGATPVLYSLYSKHLQVSNLEPDGLFRDRFVLSAGHGSAMLYSVLHFFGFPISLKQISGFRQVNSICAGHPERDSKLGIEVTTGPLGQGVANAVGMAIAERHLASVFNKKDAQIFNNHTYALVGDGCLMEGVSYEALSLAGTLNLNKLIVIYDFNKITIDGKIDTTFKQNTKNIFKGFGFNVIEVKNGNSLSEIDNAISKAKRSSKPTLIMVNSIIGFGSVLANSEKAHGSPLGSERMAQLQTTLEMPTKEFEILPQVNEHLLKVKQKYKETHAKWKSQLENYKLKYPKDHELLMEYKANNFKKLDKVLNDINIDKKSISTRDLSGIVLNEISKHFGNIIVGSADLVASTKAEIKNSGKFSFENPNGRNIMFGVREFAMSAISNGIASYGALVPFASTFFVFSDYMRAGIRLSAISHLKVPYILTHDSIGVGEDGPTHQPIEHIASFRAMPNVSVIRPANEAEVKASYSFALKQNKPTLMLLTRQNVLNFESDLKQAKMGGYVLVEEQGQLDCVLIATGSEVQLALSVYDMLFKKGINARVVSLPSWDIFEMQTQEYKNSVIPANFKNIVSIEAGSTFGWDKFVGAYGLSIGIDEFGKSGKIEDVYEHFNLTKQNVYEQVLSLIKKNKKL